MPNGVGQAALADNIVYFANALRKAGVPVGTAQVLDAIKAIGQVGFSKRADFRTALRSMMITRPDHRLIFDEVFTLFWRDPEFLEQMIKSMLPLLDTKTPEAPKKPAQSRAAEALAHGHGAEQRQESESLELDAELSASVTEKLAAKDFEAMNLDETRQAEQAIRDMRLALPRSLSRRWKRSTHGVRVDQRAALRTAMRTGGEVLTLPKRQQKPRVLNLVVICDISGSMAKYARMMMHFVHTIARYKGADWAQVHGFTFGTRLTNITPNLDIKDPDAALHAIGQQVQDWEGGTQIGQCLKTFNQDWARRVLAGPAVVMLITDGLEREASEVLAKEAERLARSAGEFIWLNPLLRWDQFQPEAAGIRALLPHVSRFLPCHNLASLADLSSILSTPHTGATMGEKTKLVAT